MELFPKMDQPGQMTEGSTPTDNSGNTVALPMANIGVGSQMNAAPSLTEDSVSGAELCGKETVLSSTNVAVDLQKNVMRTNSVTQDTPISLDKTKMPFADVEAGYKQPENYGSERSQPDDVPLGSEPSLPDVSLPGTDLSNTDSIVSGNNPPVSLEGRKAQLEEKITTEMERQQENAFGSYPMSQNYSNSSPGVYEPPAKPPKPAMSQGAKAYIILIAGLLLVFVVGFGIECARAYNQNGLFGGDIERFVDTDFEMNPFGKDSDNDKNSFYGLFPFAFDDSDIETDEDNSPNSGDDSDAAAKNIKSAPDLESAIDPAAAVLEAKDQPGDIDSAEYTARKAYKRVEGSVVNVVVYTEQKYVGNESYQESTGTGIIVSSNGYIITNSHVVSDTTERGVEIIDKDGNSFIAVIVGCDSRTDLAVLKINASGLTPVEFVDSQQIEVGQDALAVGNPGGLNYSNSLTRGCVSALNRTIPSSTMVSYIQTDAAINPGNSGGPLLNSAGQVMGITTVKIANTSFEGMGFAIPSNIVIEIANSIISKGYVEGRVRLGVYASVYTGGALEGIEGIEIQSIMDDSPLKKTDVREGDVITKLNGKNMPNFNVFYNALGEFEPGDSVTLTIYRPPTPGDAGKTFEVSVQLVADEGRK